MYKLDSQAEKRMGAHLSICLGLKTYSSVASEESISDYGDEIEDPFSDVATELDESFDENPWRPKSL